MTLRAFTISRRRTAGGYYTSMGDLFHLSSAADRDSILAHGLDWTRMGAAPGIAGSTAPEADGVFLCADGWPGAAQDRLPALSPGTGPGCPDIPQGPGEGGRTTRAPARERRAAQARRPGPV